MMLTNIQFLRFVAAMLVVFYHANTHVLATGVEQGFFFAAAESLGFAGVDIFFVISGFIMFYSTRESAGVSSSFDFIRRRAARIYSGYWPFVIAAFFVFGWARPEHIEGTRFLESFFLWPVPMNLLVLDVSWTLTYEMYFYVLFAFLLLLSPDYRWRLMAFGLGAFVFYCLYRHFVREDFSVENLGMNSFNNLFFLSAYLMEFFAGAVLARFHRNGSEALGWLLLSGGIAGFAGAGWVNHVVFEGNIEFGYYLVPRVLLFGIPSTMIVMGLVWLEQHGRTAPLKFSLLTGGASYAIYLSHTLFQVSTMKLGLDHALSGYSTGIVETIYLVYSFLIVLFCVGWFVYVEKPLYRFFRKLLRVNPGGDR